LAHIGIEKKKIRGASENLAGRAYQMTWEADDLRTSNRHDVPMAALQLPVVASFMPGRVVVGNVRRLASLLLMVLRVGLLLGIPPACERRFLECRRPLHHTRRLVHLVLVIFIIFSCAVAGAATPLFFKTAPIPFLSSPTVRAAELGLFIGTGTLSDAPAAFFLLFLGAGCAGFTVSGIGSSRGFKHATLGTLDSNMFSNL